MNLHPSRWSAGTALRTLPPVRFSAPPRITGAPITTGALIVTIAVQGGGNAGTPARFREALKPAGRRDGYGFIDGPSRATDAASQGESGGRRLRHLPPRISAVVLRTRKTLGERARPLRPSPAEPQLASYYSISSLPVELRSKMGLDDAVFSFFLLSLFSILVFFF